MAAEKALPLPRGSPETRPALARRQNQQALRPITLTCDGVCCIPSSDSGLGLISRLFADRLAPGDI